MLLLLDNRDSFVFNLDQAFRALGAETKVLRSDRTTAAEALAFEPDGLVLSPGPGRPEDAGCMLELVRAAPNELPILGVCLGHQALGQVAGASIVRAPEVYHGRVSEITHDGSGLFESLPSPLAVCRYHSLMLEPRNRAETAPPGYRGCAVEPEQGVLMAMRHERLPRWGFQFHPESFQSPRGDELLARFWREVVQRRSERRAASPTQFAG